MNTRKLIVINLLIILLALTNFSNVLAHGDSDGFTSIKKENSYKPVTDTPKQPKLTNEQSLNFLKKGLKIMKSMINENDFEKINNDVVIMMAWHDTDLQIQEALEALEYYAGQMDGLKKNRILGSLLDLSESIVKYKIFISVKNIEKSKTEVAYSDNALNSLSKAMK